jgi:hypothetical protein
MNDKVKLPVSVWASGGDDASVPRVPCRLNKPVMAGEVNEIGKRLGELMRILNVRECPSCHKLQQQCKNLAGICTECWTHCDDLADRFDFSGLPDHEIARHWCKLSRTLFDYKADGGKVKDGWRNGPPDFGMAAGIEATLGIDRIVAALPHDWAGTWSWNSMAWDADLGLVPHPGKHPKLSEYQAWQNYWHRGAGYKKCFVKKPEQLAAAA